MGSVASSLIGKSVRLVGTSGNIGRCLTTQDSPVGPLAEVEKRDGRRSWIRAATLTIFQAEGEGAAVAEVVASPAKAERVADPDDDGMNKTERRYSQEVLEPARLRGEIRAWRFESIRLKLGHDCWYWPDFMVEKPDGTTELHEVKGFMQDDARVKLSVCADLYRAFPLYLVKANSRAVSGDFTIVRIVPGSPKGGTL